MVKFAKLTKDERAAVGTIVARARRFDSRPPMDITMDLSAVHARVPLRLREMAEADDFNLAHDVCGIARHLNRETGELENCFVPRFAKPLRRHDRPGTRRRIMEALARKGA